MANNKKSFLLHIDSLDILDDLTNGQAGVLFKAIKAYQKGEDYPLDSVVKIAFSPFKNQFIRDNEKYAKTCERRAIAGSKGGKQKVANASKCKQDLANVADTKNKNKNKTKNKSDNYNKEPSVSAKPKPKKYSEDDLKTAEFMKSRILVISPHAKFNSETSANTIRLMREQDNLNHADICRVFDWANKDHFWQSNILSADKLRKQFARLDLESKKNTTSKHNLENLNYESGEL